MARANLVLGGLLLVCASWYLWLTDGTPRRRLPHDPGLAFVPRILAVALIGLSVVLVLQQLVRWLPRPVETPPAPLSPSDWARTAGLVALTVAWVVLLPVAGFLATTPVYLVAAAHLSGARRWLAAVLGAVAVTLVVWVAFVHGFRVPLP